MILYMYSNFPMNENSDEPLSSSSLAYRLDEFPLQTSLLLSQILNHFLFNFLVE